MSYFLSGIHSRLIEKSGDLGRNFERRESTFRVHALSVPMPSPIGFPSPPERLAQSAQRRRQETVIGDTVIGDTHLVPEIVPINQGVKRSLAPNSARRVSLGCRIILGTGPEFWRKPLNSKGNSWGWHQTPPMHNSALAPRRVPGSRFEFGICDFEFGISA
jgi:hypothetical protein